MVGTPTVLLLAGGELLSDVTDMVLSARMSDRAWHEVGTLDLTISDPDGAIRAYIALRGIEAADLAVIVDYSPLVDGEERHAISTDGRWSGRVDSAIQIDSEAGEVSLQATQDNAFFEDLFLAPDVGRALEAQSDRQMLYTGYPTSILAYILMGTIARDVYGRPPVPTQQTHRPGKDPEIIDRNMVHAAQDIAVARATVDPKSDLNDVAKANSPSSSSATGAGDVSVLLRWQSAAELLDEVQRISGISARVYRALPGAYNWHTVSRSEYDYGSGKVEDNTFNVGSGGIYIDWVGKYHLEGIPEVLRSQISDVRIPLMDKREYPRLEVRPGGATGAVSVSDSPTWLKDVVKGSRALAIALVRAAQGDEAADSIEDVDVDKILGTLGGVDVEVDTTRKRRHAHVQYELVDGVSADEVIQGSARRRQVIYDNRARASIPEQITPPEWVRPGIDIRPGSLVTVEVSERESVTEYVEEISASWGHESEFEWTFSIGESTKNVLEELTLRMAQIGRQMAATGRATLA